MGELGADASQQTTSWSNKLCQPGKSETDCDSLIAVNTLQNSELLDPDKPGQTERYELENRCQCPVHTTMSGCCSPTWWERRHVLIVWRCHTG